MRECRRVVAQHAPRTPSSPQPGWPASQSSSRGSSRARLVEGVEQDVESLARLEGADEEEVRDAAGQAVRAQSRSASPDASGAEPREVHAVRRHDDGRVVGNELVEFARRELTDADRARGRASAA